MAERGKGEFVPLKPATKLHEYLIDEFERLRVERGQKSGILAPRGGAKTTWTSFAQPIWAGCHRYEPFIVLLSDTGKQARMFLRDIRRQFEMNQKIKRNYPSAFGVGPIWSSDAIQLRNGVLIAAFGTGGHIRGVKRDGESRPSQVIIDDPQSKEDIPSALMRERAWDWFTRDVLPVGSPSTNFLAVGTALHREAIMCRIQDPKSCTGWKVRVFKAIEQWPQRLDLWRDWESILFEDTSDDKARALAFYHAHQKEMEQ